MRVDALQLAPVVETLIRLDWVGRMAEDRADEDARLVLLVNPVTTPIEPLLREMLLIRSAVLAPLWDMAPLGKLFLGEVIAAPRALLPAPVGAGVHARS